MLSRILNRILSKITNEIREIAEFISLEICSDENDAKIVELVRCKTKDKGKKNRLGIMFKNNQDNTSHSAIVNARNRRMMFNINFLKGKLENANALWNGKTISARKELR